MCKKINLKNQTVVLKIGTTSLLHNSGKFDFKKVRRIVSAICRLIMEGHKIVVVASGAVAIGMNITKSPRPPDGDTIGKQMLASIGQPYLMSQFIKTFGKNGHNVGQKLLTKQAMGCEIGISNFAKSINRFLELGIIPVINENDAIAAESALCGRFGNNDVLAAEVARAIKADMLCILTDVDGIFTSDPRKNKDACLVSTIHQITNDTYEMVTGAGSNLGTGGFITKVEAAGIATRAGISTVIINGYNPERLHDFIIGNHLGIGTIFPALPSEVIVPIITFNAIFPALPNRKYITSRLA
jgi:glutamate 5-kinase